MGFVWFTITFRTRLFPGRSWKGQAPAVRKFLTNCDVVVYELVVLGFDKSLWIGGLWMLVCLLIIRLVTSVRNMWRQRSPCTRGWPATLLMKSCGKIFLMKVSERIKMNFGALISADQLSFTTKVNFVNICQKLPQDPPSAPQWTPPQRFLFNHSFMKAC